MKELYENLYETFNFQEQKKEVKDFFNQSVYFVSGKGKLYESNAQKYKMLVVGRATNDWEKESDYKNKEEFGEWASNKLKRENTFEWIKKENNECYIKRSAFWRTNRKVWEKINGQESTENWYENIAWSNLYKIAPRSGNPSSKMAKIQIECCKKILKREIDEFKPQVVLLVLGWDWFIDIKDCFQCVKHIGKYNDDKKSFVEGVGYYNEIPVIITCRPECKNEMLYVEQVEKYFKDLNNKGTLG